MVRRKGLLRRKPFGELVGELNVNPEFVADLKKKDFWFVAEQFYDFGYDDGLADQFMIAAHKVYRRMEERVIHYSVKKGSRDTHLCGVRAPNSNVIEVTELPSRVTCRRCLERTNYFVRDERLKVVE